MNNAILLINEAIDKLIPADKKYFDYAMGLVDMAAELGAITQEQRKELAEGASYALYHKLREEKTKIFWTE